MTVDECIKYTTQVAMFDINMLIIRIGESWKKHDNNIKLSKLDRFLLGLRYSEFLATDDSDLGYYQAELKRQAILKNLGITVDQINLLVQQVLGLY